MKKITIARKKWLTARSTYELRKRKHKKLAAVNRRSNSKAKLRDVHHVSVWYGDRMDEAVATRKATIPPASICFDKNTDESIEFFNSWREKFKVIKNDGPKE